jgi:hypothetical protein
MGRFLSASSGGDGAFDIASGALDYAGRLPIFGTGNWRVFLSESTPFVIPPAITLIRVRVMLGFRRMRSLQKFAAVHGSVHTHFNAERHLYN